MSRLETLPFELHIMVLEECTPQALLALISASPVSLYIYSDNRERVLHSIRDVSKLTLEDPAALLAQSIVHLRLYHKRSIGTDLDEQDWWRFVEPLANVGAIMGGFSGFLGPMFFDFLAYRKYWDSLAFLAGHMELASRIDRLLARFQPHQPLVFAGLPSRSSKRASRALESHQVHFLRFEVYCQSFFHGNRALSDKAAEYRATFFQRAIEVDVLFELHLVAKNKKFRKILDYIFQEHKSVIREVAKDLGSTEYPGPSRTDLARAGPFPPQGTSSRHLQILRLDNRRLVEEDGYCRYLMSFGLGLVDRIFQMSKEERCDYTLDEFYRFSLSQTPQACFPQWDRTETNGYDKREYPWRDFIGEQRESLEWPPATAGTAWEDAIDRSGMSYTAWFWDMARLAGIGTNEY